MFFTSAVSNPKIIQIHQKVPVGKISRKTIYHERIKQNFNFKIPEKSTAMCSDQSKESIEKFVKEFEQEHEIILEKLRSNSEAIQTQDVLD